MPMPRAAAPIVNMPPSSITMADRHHPHASADRELGASTSHSVAQRHHRTGRQPCRGCGLCPSGVVTTGSFANSTLKPVRVRVRVSFSLMPPKSRSASAARLRPCWRGRGRPVAPLDRSRWRGPPIPRRVAHRACASSTTSRASRQRYLHGIVDDARSAGLHISQGRAGAAAR